MSPFAAWVAAASSRLPLYLRLDPLLAAAAGTILGLVLGGVAAPQARWLLALVLGAAAFVGLSLARGRWLASPLVDPVSALARWEIARMADGGLVASDPLEKAADDWNRLDRALETSVWRESEVYGVLRRAADTGMLQLALAREGGVPDGLREAALGELARIVERAAMDGDATEPRRDLLPEVREAARVLDAPRLARFAL